MSAAPTRKYGISVEVRGLRKNYGAQEVLKGIDFTVEPGEIFVVMGPSGSGKSVLLKHIIGLERPNEGDILLDGHSILDDGNDLMSKYRLAPISVRMACVLASLD